VVALLAGEIEGSRVSHEELLFQPELVVRGSTALAPSMDGRRGQGPLVGP
jgi:hypothetical protein